MINGIQSKYNTPQLQKACKILSRKLFMPKAQTSFDMAEIGGKVILSSDKSGRSRVLFLNIERTKDSGYSLLKKGTRSQIRNFLKENKEAIASKIEDLEDMMKRAAEDTKKFMTGF